MKIYKLKFVFFSSKTVSSLTKSWSWRFCIINIKDIDSDLFINKIRLNEIHLLNLKFSLHHQSKMSLGIITYYILFTASNCYSGKNWFLTLTFVAVFAKCARGTDTFTSRGVTFSWVHTIPTKFLAATNLIPPTCWATWGTGTRFISPTQAILLV